MFFIYINFKNQVYIKSSIDNQYYLVNNCKDKQIISDTLSQVRRNIIYLSENIVVTKNNQLFIKNIRNKIYSTKFIQNKNKFPKKSNTSYSVNKGEKIVLCVYDYKNEHLYKFNTIMYVAIHELAHIGNPTFGHDESFYFIFNNLIQEAIRLEVYKFYDYEKIPVKYCGISIESNL